MQTPGLLVIELMAFGVAVYAIVAMAVQKRWLGLFASALAVPYSFVAEALCVHVGTYTYARALVPIPFPVPCPSGTHQIVPLWVPIGWGTIVAFSTVTAVQLEVGVFAQAAAAALLALHLDLSLDPVATGLHFWSWNPPSAVLGVPFQNFTGWLMLVGFYALSVGWARNKMECLGWYGWKDWWKLGGGLVLATLVALVLFLVPSWALNCTVNGSVAREGCVFVLVLLACLVGVGRKASAMHTDRDLSLWGIPLGYHGTVIILALSEGLLWRLGAPLGGAFAVAVACAAAAFYMDFQRRRQPGAEDTAPPCPQDEGPVPAPPPDRGPDAVDLAFNALAPTAPAPAGALPSGMAPGPAGAPPSGMAPARLPAPAPVHPPAAMAPARRRLRL